MSASLKTIFKMGQSKVSYHVRKLKEAGLSREEKRGKWSFYSLNREAVQELLHETTGHLGSARGILDVAEIREALCAHPTSTSRRLRHAYAVAPGRYQTHSQPEE